MTYSYLGRYRVIYRALRHVADNNDSCSIGYYLVISFSFASLFLFKVDFSNIQNELTRSKPLTDRLFFFFCFVFVLGPQILYLYAYSSGRLRTYRSHFRWDFRTARIKITLFSPPAASCCVFPLRSHLPSHRPPRSLILSHSLYLSVRQ